MDEKSLLTVEFDKVRERVAVHAKFPPGKDRVLSLKPTSKLKYAKQRQAETAEAIHCIEQEIDLSLGGLRDIRIAVKKAKQRGILLPEELLNVKKSVAISRTVRRTLDKHREIYPHLFAVVEVVEECPGLVTAISQSISDRADVLDSASPELATLRRQISRTHSKLQERLQSLINGKSRNYLQEPIISQRNGRYVIPLRADNKGKIKGIVHDQSSSGATLWLEPLSIVDLNNDYRTLQSSEDQEILRILKELSFLVTEVATPLHKMMQRMGSLDAIFARALYSLEIRGVEPDFVPWRQTNTSHPGSTIQLENCRHPLLDPHEVVPTNIVLDEDVYSVIITGPNTGGKTVSLKNIGLMVLMAQSGLQLPADSAKLTVFANFFADIGDEQSIEQSLSTFSAHMTNVIRVLEQANNRSLLVFDELGSGTDPTEGAAIAQAIIQHLHAIGVSSFIATHYPELKLYASQTEGVTNASLLFDIETLSPTYELAIGIPGRSNALAISKGLGMPESILEVATQYVGATDEEAGSLIDSIFNLREKISAEEASTRIALKEAEKQRDLLLLEAADLELQRDKILDDARKDAEKELEDIRLELHNLRKDMRKAKQGVQLGNISQQLTGVEKTLAKKKPVRKPLSTANPPKNLQVGDTVFVKTLNAKGTILSLQKKQAEVSVGRLHTRVKLRDLEFRNRASDKKEAAEDVTPVVTSRKQVGIDLDLRGKMIEEALQALDYHLDNASLQELPWVNIIHGKGTGRLRNAVRQALRSHHTVASWKEAPDNEGGSGATIATLKV